MIDEKKMIGGISLLTIGILLFGIFFVGKNEGKPAVLSAEDTAVLTRNAKHTIRAKDATLTLVEFADFQCPACAAAHPILKSILNTYKGKVTFIYRHFPLAQHQQARLAAKASEAAAEEGKFWEMYDLLYQNQEAWIENDNAKDMFISYAKKLKLNEEVFKKNIESNKYDESIQKDFSDGTSLGVNSTPTFFLNGEKLNLRSFGDLEREIERKIK